jgi:hypothetical protein
MDGQARDRDCRASVPGADLLGGVSQKRPTISPPKNLKKSLAMADMIDKTERDWRY